jgi:RimJ/RimL family protein N-acetyltransferase
MSPQTPSERVEILPWGPGDLGLLTQLVGDPLMMEHLGGPESAEKIADRQRRYEDADETTGTFKVVLDGQGVGWVGYWDRDWRGERVYEIGWSVLPACQGRGIAGVATGQAIELARAEDRNRFVHAFPGVDNAPSNAICRKLGFMPLGAVEFEYPPGSQMRCNDWRLDLRAARTA